MTTQEHAKKTKTHSWAQGITDSLGGQKVNLNISNIKVKPLQLIEVIKKLSFAAPETRDEILSQIKRNKTIA